MARQVRALGVRPEIEVFDTGHLVFAKQLLAEGLVDEPALLQLCMGIPYGAPDDPGTLLALVNQLPAECVFSAFAIGRMQLPYVALAPLVGGNVRVGLEDNIWLERGVKATNADLVDSCGHDSRGDERAGARARRGPREAPPDRALMRIALVGGGVIGGGWAGRLVECGYDVVLHDPHPQAERRVREVLDNAERAWAQLTLAPPEARSGHVRRVARRRGAGRRRRPGERARGRGAQAAPARRRSTHARRLTRSSAPRRRAFSRRGCRPT